jgi:SpoIID/LytB domain protein
MRRALLAAGLAGCLLAVPSETRPARAAVPVLVIDGRGFGHGVGMAQDGALWMGVGGANLAQIIGHFYPGTALGKSAGIVRVSVLTSDPGDATLVFPNGGQLRDAPDGPQSPGFPVDIAPGGSVRVWWDGARYHAQKPTGTYVATAARAGIIPTTTTTPAGATTTTTAPPSPPTLFPPPTAPPSPTATTTTTAPRAPGSSAPPFAPPPRGPTAPDASSPRPLWAVPANYGTVAVPARGDRRYRGLTEAVADGPKLRLVNQLDVEDYLRGMGEVRSPSWPQPSLQAQAVAARTYALRAMKAGGEICDYDRCQVYLGAQAEYPAMDKAVAATRGTVVVFNGGFASTVYSSNGGGVSATTEEGFGTDSTAYPYLRAAPYVTRDPAPWQVRVGLGDVAARFGVPGGVTNGRIAEQGPSGRALAIALDGNGGGKALDAHSFAAGLGLRSTLFTLRVEQADVAPAAPAAGDFIQVPPDQAAALAAAAPPPDALTKAAPADAVPRLPSGHGRERENGAEREHRWPVALFAVGLVVALGAVHAKRRFSRT